MRHLSRRLSSVLIVLVAGLGILVSPLRAAEGKLDYIAKFQQPNIELDVDTYTRGAEKVGMLAIKAGSVNNAFACKANDWSKLIALVAKAAQARSPGSNWTVVGAMSEHDTTDVSHLVVSAGAGLRFALNSPKGASLTYVLPDRDVPRFLDALGRVKQYFAAP